MNEIKLKLSVDGAVAAKKAVEDVTDAVTKTADAEKKASDARIAAAVEARKAAQAAAEEARRAREAVAAVDAQIATEKKLASAKVEAAAAAARKAKEEEDNKAPERPGADPTEIEKVISSQEEEKTKGKKVLPSSAGTGTIN